MSDLRSGPEGMGRPVAWEVEVMGWNKVQNVVVISGGNFPDIASMMEGCVLPDGHVFDGRDDKIMSVKRVGYVGKMP